MCMKLACLSILAVLLCSADALKLKNPQDEYDLSVNENEYYPGPNETEYHKAPGVKPGQCTKQLKPTLFFIGHAYSGSTSLSDTMRLHPELGFGKTKEHQFFNKNLKQIESDEKYNNYLDEFWVHCNTTVTYDATMDYLYIPESHEALNYMHKRMGAQAKFMLMIRDPLDIVTHDICHKAGSANPKHTWTEKVYPDFNKGAVNLSHHNHILGTEHLSEWLRVFPDRNKWLFLDSEEYFASPEKVLKKVFAFSGVADIELNATELKESAGRRRCAMKPSAAERKAFWSVKQNKEEKSKLEGLTGLKFHWQ